MGASDKVYEANLEEMTLNGVRNMQEAVKNRWMPVEGFNAESLTSYTKVTLAPRQIRSFKVSVTETTETNGAIKTTPTPIKVIAASTSTLSPKVPPASHSASNDKTPTVKSAVIN